MSKKRRIFDSILDTEESKPKKRNSDKKQEAEVEETHTPEVMPAVVVEDQPDQLATQPPPQESSIMVPEEKMLHRTQTMQCNTCFLQDKCPSFQENADCSIDWARLFKGEFKPSNVLESSAIILDLQLMRIQRAAHFEMFNEGIIDPELSKEISRYFDMLAQVKAISDNSTAISITAKGEAAKKGGVLAQLLGLNS